MTAFLIKSFKKDFHEVSLVWVGKEVVDFAAVPGVNPWGSAISFSFLEKSLRKTTSEPGGIPSVESAPGVSVHFGNSFQKYKEALWLKQCGIDFIENNKFSWDFTPLKIEKFVWKGCRHIWSYKIGAVCLVKYQVYLV